MNLKLIELVRIARKRGHNFVTIDRNNSSYSSYEKPRKFNSDVWGFVDAYQIGDRYTYDLKCHWTKAIIDVSKLRGVS